MSARRNQSEARGTSDRQWFALNVIMIAVILTMIVTLGAYGGVNAVMSRDVFAQNISVDGRKLSGLTYEEGKEKILGMRDEKLNGVSVTVQYGDAEKTFGAAELGVSTNAEDVLKRAYSYNRQDGSAFDNYTRTYDDVQLTTEYTIDETALEQTLNSFISEYEKGPLDATAEYNEDTGAMEYTESRSGAKVDREQMIADVKDRLLNGGGVPVVVTDEALEPEYDLDDLKATTTLIGECTTEITDSDENRLKNIKRMCNVIDGTVLQPGERLSLNALTGERTEADGYLPAPTISDGTPGVNSVGGGVSQAAGTLYNAALKADMEIIERVRHSWPSDYLGIGLDAELAWEDKDLVIANSSDFPVYIGMKTDGSNVTAKIFGQPSGYDIKIENTVLQEIEPPVERTVNSDEYPAGSTQVTQARKTGYEVEVYRNHLQNGVVVEREKISYDYFPETGKVTTIGTG